MHRRFKRGSGGVLTLATVARSIRKHPCRRGRLLLGVAGVQGWVWEGRRVSLATMEIARGRHPGSGIILYLGGRMQGRG